MISKEKKQARRRTRTEEDAWLRGLVTEAMKQDEGKLEELMEQINRDPAYKNIEAPQEIHDRLFEQIREYEENNSKNG